MRARFLTLIIIFLLGVSGLIWRLVDLMVSDHAFLLGQGNARSLRVITLPAYRGIITDRDGEPLAVSTPVLAVWIEPKEFTASDEALGKLSELLQLKPQEIRHRVEENKNREFVYLKRGLDPFIEDKVKALNITGLYLQREFKRYYPEGEVTAQLVGLTNIDDQGQEGIELSFNNWLTGISGRVSVIKDRMGHPVADVNLIRSSQPGHNLALSIDRRIQYLAYRELKRGVEENKAESGSVVVMDIRTGEVLAMVNQPSYNPNNRPVLRNGQFRNRAVTDLFEPGSTMKSFSVTYALSTGKFTAHTPIDTNPGWFKVSDNIVKDMHNYGLLDVTSVLQHSSNVGVSKIMLTLPPQPFWQLLQKIGFGESTQSGFPGESSGVLTYRPVWSHFMFATLAFGYGMSVTNLQLASAYATLANKGVKLPVSLIKIDQPPKGTPALKEKVAQNVISMLENVVSTGGTAVSAQTQDYRVGGKTGTVRLIGSEGYEKDHHLAIFVGVAPVTNPRLVVSVVIKDPKKEKYTGGQVSAPVFAKIMEAALQLLNVPPDRIKV